MYPLYCVGQKGSFEFFHHGGASGKETTCQCRRRKWRGFDPWVGKILCGRQWQPTSSILAWKVPWTEGCQWAIVHSGAKSQERQGTYRKTEMNFFWPARYFIFCVCTGLWHISPSWQMALTNAKSLSCCLSTSTHICVWNHEVIGQVVLSIEILYLSSCEACLSQGLLSCQLLQPWPTDTCPLHETSDALVVELSFSLPWSGDICWTGEIPENSLILHIGTVMGFVLRSKITVKKL